MSRSASMRGSLRWSAGLRHRVLQDPRRDGVPLGLVGVEQALGRGAPDDLGELPAEVDRVLHAEADPLSAGRRVDVRGVAGEQHASAAVGRRLPGGVGEPGDPGRVVDARSRCRTPRSSASLRSARSGSPAGPSSLLGHDDPHGPPVRPSRLSPWMPTASRRMPHRRLLGHLDLGDQVAARRLAAGEIDAGRLADDAAPAVAADEVRRAQRLAVGELDVDAGRRPGRSR